MLSTLRVIKADAVALDRHWEFLRERLLIVKTRTNNPEIGREANRIRWQPIQMRAAIMRGLMGQSTVEMFFVLAPDDEIRGFFVTTRNVDEFLGIPMDFFIWVTWTDGTFDVADHCEPEIVKLARERGCACIKGMTSREGYVRRLKGKGYYIEYVNVRKDLVNE